MGSLRTQPPARPRWLRARSFLALAAAAAASVALALPAAGDGRTFHVSADGDDANDGLTPATAWRTVAKVNSTQFLPGDSILFRRGDEWRESLSVSSSGAPGAPITFGAYGDGAKPRFWGSDVLPNAAFRPLEGTSSTYVLDTPAPVGSVFGDHQFLRSAWLINGGAPTADHVATVRETPGTWYHDGQRLYVNTGGSDPRSDGRVYTAAVRESVVAANLANYVTFRDLVTDETARYNGGYGFGASWSDYVTFEDCEAYRAGKHHFGVLNSDGFVGRGLYAAIAMPDQGIGGATALVSYADYHRDAASSQWIDTVVENLGGNYPAFYSHGDGMGDLVIENLVARGASVSWTTENPAGQHIVMRGGTIEGSGIGVWGDDATIEGVRLIGPGAVIGIRGERNTVRNNLIAGAAPDGYRIVVADEGHDNVFLFNTIVIAPDARPGTSAFYSAAKDSRTRFQGNIVVGGAYALYLGFDGLGDLTVDQNLYYPSAVVRRPGSLQSFDDWRALGYDLYSLIADPRFRDPASGDYRLSLDSPAIDAAVGLDPSLLGVLIDLLGNPRVSGRYADLGAFEVQESEYRTLRWNPAGSPAGASDAGGQWLAEGAWSDDSGAPATWDPSVPQRAVLGAGEDGDGTPGEHVVTLAAPVNVRTLRFSDGPAAYRLSGGSITLSGYFTTLFAEANATIESPVVAHGPQGWDVADGRTLVVSGRVEGSVVHKTGPGDLVVLNAANAHAGFVVRSGRLLVDAGGALGGGGGNGGAATLTLDGGVLAVQAPLTATIPVIVGAAGGGIDTSTHDVILAGPVSGQGLLVKSGPGSLALTHPLTTVASAAILEGRAEVAGGIAGEGASVVASGATLVVGYLRQEALTIQGSGRVELAPLDAAVQASHVRSLAFDAGTAGGAAGTLDVGTSALVFQSDADHLAADLADLNALLEQGRQEGRGIVSSAAAADPTGARVLALIPNDRGNGALLAPASFRGVATDAYSILIAFAKVGDLDLDGTLSAADYYWIDRGRALGLEGYGHGDLDFSGGAPGPDDYLILDTAFLAERRAGAPSGGAPAALPEPAALGATLPLAVGLLLRRRHRRNAVDGRPAGRLVNGTGRGV